jgi:hypothetical protein
VSGRYAIQGDGRGNENNVWDPKRIIWTKERKKFRGNML